MEIPDRIKQHLDGESIQSAVSLGDEDVACFTPSRTFLYRGEGLLSDESLTAYDHDVERLTVSEGRRKTTFQLEYVDSVEKFKVTNKRAEQVLTRLLAGVLGTKGVLEAEESVTGVFLFSELTLVITDSRLVKHVGSYVWDPDFEEYPYSEVTGLEFEEGSVATQIIISVEGRPQRIKAPSDQGKKLRRTLSEALFSYHDVGSLAELNEKIGEEPEPAEETENGGLALDSSISPLVSDSSTESESGETSESETADETAAVTEDSANTNSTETPVVAEATTESTARTAEEEVEQSSVVSGDTVAQPPGIDPDDVAEMQAQLSKLTTAVEQQQEQLEAQSEQIQKQRETIAQLIEELRHKL